MASILERNKKVKTPKKTREEYAEDALYREVWEEVNNEKTQRFIKKYSRYLVAGALTILIAATALQIGLRMHRDAKVAMATNYETAVLNADVGALGAIGNSGRGATADLALFQSYMLDHDVAKIEKLARDGNTRDFRDLARLHVVGIKGDDMTAAEVEKYLSPLNTKSSPYYYVGMLTVAQKHLGAGDTNAAQKWLDKIIGDKNAPATISAAAAALK